MLGEIYFMLCIRLSNYVVLSYIHVAQLNMQYISI